MSQGFLYTQSGAVPVNIAPTRQVFLSGSGTYTTPTNPAPMYLKIRMVAGGGGGGASSNSASSAGATGGNTTFGTSLLTASGGIGGNGGFPVGGIGGVGGAASGGNISNIQGAYGMAGNNSSTAGNNFAGASGGNSYWGGAGIGGDNYLITSFPGRPNTGGGGGGGPCISGTPTYGGGGGGAGGFIEHVLTTPAASYAYAVGAGGAGGATGTYPGSAGGSGQIIVEEYYQGFLNSQGIDLSSTGSGVLVRTTAPTLSQPVIMGVNNGSNAVAGQVGEYISNAVLQASQFSIAASTATAVTSISLSAGDWLTSGNIYFAANGGTGTFQQAIAGINTSIALPDNSLVSSQFGATNSFFAAMGLPVFTQRISLASTTTVYLIAQTAGYGAGVTLYVSGFIGARRVR